jgi:hypothetical protein
MMETQNIVVDREEARALYRKYREHQHWSEPIDDEIRRTYQLIAQGRVIIRALDSIVKAGVGADGYPKLAIVRADAARCWYSWSGDGSGRFAVDRWTRHNQTRQYIDLPAGSFATPRTDRPDWSRAQAITPLVPIHLRPKRGLANYHILFEAVWHAAPPLDPMLLRRIGRGDLWVVVAAWDLTEVERAALAARL